jgi:lysophospholipase L1-like esterase
VRGEVVVASVIALSGLLAAGQAIKEGLKDPPPPEKPFDRSTIRCVDSYEPTVSGHRAVRVAVLGDAVTAWRPPDHPATSWVTYARGNGVRVAQDWVDPDATVQKLSTRVTATRADVLVVLAGTNDLRADTANDQVELGLQRAVERAGVDKVLISSIPPVPYLTQETADFNELLARIAYRHDWSFVDAGTTVVDDNCSFSSGMRGPGARPSAEGARRIGSAVQGALTTRTDLAPAD